MHKNGFKKQSTKPRGRLPILLPMSGPPAPGHLPCFYRLTAMYRLSSEHQNISHPQTPRTDLGLTIELPGEALQPSGIATAQLRRSLRGFGVSTYMRQALNYRISPRFYLYVLGSKAFAK